jgi:hypothetical protein
MMMMIFTYANYIRGVKICARYVYIYVDKYLCMYVFNLLHIYTHTKK